MLRKKPVGTFAFSVIVSLVASVVSAAWYDADLIYRQEINVSSSVTGSDLTNFPLLVKIADAGNPIFGKAQSNGYDILFTDANGNKLDHEIEFYSDGAAKEVDAWVNTGSLGISSGSDTKLYMYYGNLNTVATSPNSTDTWDGNFKMVQHLQETSGTHADSTSNNNHGTEHGGVAQNATGKIDGADQLDGINDNVVVANSPSLDGINSSFTAELWFKYLDEGPSTKAYWTLLGKNKSGSGYNAPYQLYVVKSSKTLQARAGTGSAETYLSTSGSVADDEFHRIVMVFDDDADEYYLYKDANSRFVRAVGSSWVGYSDDSDVYIGEWQAYNDHFNGIIDEVRISNTARSADWVAASYLIERYEQGDQFVTFAQELKLPEPSTFLLAATALGCAVLLRRRRR